MTNRRSFLKLGAGAAAGAAVVLGLPAGVRHALAAQKMTGVYYVPASYPALTWGTQGFVDYLKKNAQATTVDFYGGGELLKADQQLPALRSGNIDFMFHTTSYVTRSLPSLGILGLPGVVGDLYEHGERVKIGAPLFDLMNEELAKKDLYMLTTGGGILEPEYIWSTRDKPIRSLGDLRGKKLRLVGYEATAALEKYGVSAVRIPSSETYLALQRGTVDACVLNISTVVGRSLHEQLAYCYQLPVTAFTVALFTLRSTWEKLPRQVRADFEAGARWYDEHFVEYCNAEAYPSHHWKKVNGAGIEIIEPTEEELASFDDASKTAREHWIGEAGKDFAEKAIALARGEA